MLVDFTSPMDKDLCIDRRVLNIVWDIKYVYHSRPALFNVLETVRTREIVLRLNQK